MNNPEEVAEIGNKKAPGAALARVSDNPKKRKAQEKPRPLDEGPVKPKLPWKTHGGPGIGGR